MQLSTVDNFMETCTVLCVFTGLQNPASRTSDDVSRACFFFQRRVSWSVFSRVFFLRQGAGGRGYRTVVPRLGRAVMAPQNVRFLISETRDRAAAVRLEYRNGTMLSRTHATSGCAAVAVTRSGGRALKQESVPGFSSGDVSVVRTRG